MDPITDRVPARPHVVAEVHDFPIRVPMTAHPGQGPAIALDPATVPDSILGNRVRLTIGGDWARPLVSNGAEVVGASVDADGSLLVSLRVTGAASIERMRNMLLGTSMHGEFYPFDAGFKVDRYRVADNGRDQIAEAITLWEAHHSPRHDRAHPATTPPNAARVVASLMDEYGQAMRGDWSGMDGGDVRSVLDTLAGSLTSGRILDQAAFRREWRLCPDGQGHWTDYCRPDGCDPDL